MSAILSRISSSVARVTFESLDKLAFGYRTDAELASFLEVEHNTIATIRSGKSALGPKPKLKILAQATKAFEPDALIASVESSKKLVKLLQHHLKHLNRTPSAP